MTLRPLSAPDEIPLYIENRLAGMARVEMRNGRSFVVAKIDEASRRHAERLLNDPTYRIAALAARSW